MAARPKLRARTNYITALMEPLAATYRKIEYTFNSSERERSRARKLQQRSPTMTNDRHSFDLLNSARESSTDQLVKHSSDINSDSVINYRRLKTAHSQITIDKISDCGINTNKHSSLSRSNVHSSSLSKSFKAKDEASEYSDDWESDYTDDWELDIDDESNPTDDLPKLHLKTEASTYANRLIPADKDTFGVKFCSQRQAAIDNMSFRAAVDSWTAKGLHEVVDLILRLSAGKSMIDRAWIVFYWVSQNIEYDVEAYFSGHIPRQTSEDVFASRKGVCDAFGTIFETLCAGVQLECKKIGGYAKGYSFQLEQTSFTEGNHAWNVIRLEGHWYLVDSTWGTGHLDDKKRNKKELDPYYFLVRPEQMIYRHFPEDSRWQLLVSPITMQDFFNLPFVYPTYFKLDLDIISPCSSSMALFNPNFGMTEILIRAPSNTVFSTSIEQIGVERNPVGSLVQYNADQQLWQCLFAPQTGGMHMLTVYASRKKAIHDNKNSQKMYSCVVQFGVQVPISFQGTKTFPVIYSLFTERKCQIFEPLNDTLEPGSTVTLHCRLPGVYCARLMLDGQWLSEDLVKDDIFRKQLIVPKREIELYVKFFDRKSLSSYDGLFKYILK